MIKRPTWILVVVLALLAGLAYYLQQPDNLIKKTFATAQTPTPISAGQLFGPNDGPLNSVMIQDANGQSVTIDRKSGGWTMSLGSESAIPADQSAAEQAASQAQALNLVSRIDTSSPDLSAFGLDKPAYLCKFGLVDGRTVSLKIGNLTPIENGYYAQKDDGSLVVVDKYGLEALLNLLKQPPYMFTPTPSPVPATETPTATATAASTLPAGNETPTITATP